MLPSPWLLALGLVVGLLVLLPARRLQVAGIASAWIGLYALGLWLLAMSLAIRPVGARILIPVRLVADLAPVVAAPDRVGRFLRRGGPGRSGGPGGPGGDAGRSSDARPPMKDVTPPDQRWDG